jgi:hypothetical protein
MSNLPSPYEVVDLQDGESLKLHVLSFEKGEITINPKHTPGEKVVQAIRLHVPQADKPHYPFYWDSTSKTLVAQLEPLLPSIIQNKRLVTITKRGIAPKARFTVEVT